MYRAPDRLPKPYMGGVSGAALRTVSHEMISVRPYESRHRRRRSRTPLLLACTICECPPRAKCETSWSTDTSLRSLRASAVFGVLRLGQAETAVHQLGVGDRAHALTGASRHTGGDRHPVACPSW
eukprot:1872258-Prymnesium_polylepis.1